MQLKIMMIPMRFRFFLTDRSSLTISTAFAISVLLLLIFIDPAKAESIRTHQCERSGVIRIVELQADNDSGAPCRILYHKPTEKLPTINLWNAQNDVLFCQTNYDAFIEKLESKLNWACSLVDSSQQTFVQKPQPRITAALPDEKDTQDSDARLSMAHIKTFIPSGSYTAVGGGSQTENPSACPSSGFFIWNTKSPEYPVLEMGPNHAFRFALASTSELPTAAGELSGTPSCDIPVSTGYCEQGQYAGSKPLHPALRNYFACDNKSDKPTIQRPLVLISTFATSDDSGTACEVSETSRHMALAPSQTASGGIYRDGEHDLELVILAKNAQGNSLEQGQGAICRYNRGGLK